MNFILNQKMLQEGALFLTEREAYSGVRKMADNVMNDVNLVFGSRPVASENIADLASCAIIYGTIDRSPALEQLAALGLIDVENVRGKNEVYLFQVIE